MILRARWSLPPRSLGAMSLDTSQTEAGCRSRLVSQSTGCFVNSIPAGILSHIGRTHLEQFFFSGLQGHTFWEPGFCVAPPALHNIRNGCCQSLVQILHLLLVMFT